MASLGGLANAVTGGDVNKLAEEINEFFESVSADVPPLQKNNGYTIPDTTSQYHISVHEVEKRLSKVKPNKAPGPDGITSWMLRDLSSQLAGPVAALFNSSIRDGYVRPRWKSTHITALPKKTSPQTIQSVLRPVSLTSLLAKELERFVTSWLKDIVDHQIGYLQFGNQRGVSTTHLLVKMLDAWERLWMNLILRYALFFWISLKRLIGLIAINSWINTSRSKYPRIYCDGSTPSCKAGPKRSKLIIRSVDCSQSTTPCPKERS